jgi:hypothetical protein
MEAPKSPISNLLAEFRHPNDLSAGLREIDRAMAKINDRLESIIGTAKSASATFYWVGGIIVLSGFATIAIRGIPFVASGAIAWLIAPTIVFGAAGFASSHAIILMQLFERRGYVPRVFRDPAVQFLHDFCRMCLDADVLVWDGNGRQVDRPVFRSQWAIVLFSENATVRSIFLVSAKRSFREKLAGAVVRKEIDNVSPIQAAVPSADPEGTTIAFAVTTSTGKTPIAVQKTGKRPKSGIQKRDFLTNPSEDQREKGVSNYFAVYDVPLIQHDKIRLAVKILWEHFRANMTDDYEVMLAIKAARHAIAENFPTVGLSDPRDTSGDVARDRKRKPPGPNSSVWINAIAYGTNRRLKEQLEYASGQGALPL